MRTGFSHELLKYLKSNEWAQRTNEISDTSPTCENSVQNAFHAVICLFYTYWDFRIKFCCVKKRFGFYFVQSEKRNDFFTCEKIVSRLWLIEVKSETLFHIAKFDTKISVCLKINLLIVALVFYSCYSAVLSSKVTEMLPRESAVYRRPSSRIQWYGSGLNVDSERLVWLLYRAQ